MISLNAPTYRVPPSGDIPSRKLPQDDPSLHEGSLAFDTCRPSVPQLVYEHSQPAGNSERVSL